MKAVILLGTLKQREQSNTQVLSEFLAERLKRASVDSEIIKLVDYNILPSTYSDMGEGDDWPGILDKILASQVIIFATPVWWGNHSSEMQKAIERLDNLHDEILEGKRSRLAGKVGGIVVTGDSDGAEHIIGNIANFFNAVGIALPPFASLAVLWEGQRKGAKTTREELMQYYEKTYASAAEEMVKQLKEYVQ